MHQTKHITIHVLFLSLYIFAISSTFHQVSFQIDSSLLPNSPASSSSSSSSSYLCPYLCIASFSQHFLSMQKVLTQIPDFNSLVKDIEVAWSSSNRSPVVTSSPPTQHRHKRFKAEHIPLSASSSGSTDVMGRKSPAASIVDTDEDPTVLSADFNLHSLPIPLIEPAAAQPQLNTSHRDFWNVVMGPKQLHNCKHTHTNSNNKRKPKQFSLPDRTLSRSHSDSPHPADSLSCHRKPCVDLEKPFACPSCSLRFRKRCNLMTHISNVHEKIRPFYCSLCLRRFARKSNCAKHVS